MPRTSVLGPKVARDPETDFQLVSTAEGEEGGVYFNRPAGITFNHFGGAGIMDILAALLRRLDAVFVVPGRPTLILRDEDFELLPASFRDDWPVVVARTGAETGQLIRAS